MSKPIWFNYIEKVPTVALVDIADDATWRIGSHVAGGEINEGYVEKQQAILSAVQSELERRGQG